ncbi:MAG TPA: DUF302 domain-containing protein [Dokdonella sp.]|uniref:DUF302 domain-containing protein n=1 Tax=Dokdonella sp. TaxID=2291710 RepID=UPI002D801AF8|nr:DUF302 domain-containing protein [Dokdonella sp.]HET9032206.1 DUF302 domain-containing protein [Dokdonella sp.]
MYYIAKTSKSFDKAVEDLDAAVRAHQFGVMHVHDIANTLRSKGVEFAEQCKVFEVCNPHQAARVMAADMSMNMALPCRISVYTEKGKTLIGMIRPQAMLGMLSKDPQLGAVAAEVETATIQMIDEAA